MKKSLINMKIVNIKTLIKVLTMIVLSNFQVLAYSETFGEWKASYSRRASKRGVPKDFSSKILKDIKLDKSVIEKDRKQIIFSKKVDYNSFIKKWIRKDKTRILIGRKMLNENIDLLNKIEKVYGVDKEVIISLWGVETFYGDIVGNYDVIRSLSTLAYDGRRRRFYETQLNAAMRLLKKGKVELSKFKGSWAGAFGQCQFMPSNVNAYGQDFDQDGKVDLWKSNADIFASIAYLLKKGGWKKGSSIGSLALNTKSYYGNLDKYRTQNNYNSLGFRDLSGKYITNKSWSKRRAVTIPMKNSPVLLRGSNYLSILKWNNSSLFAALNIILIDELKK